MLIIRRLEPNDAEAVSALFAQSWRFAYKGIVGDAYLNTLQDSHWTAFLTQHLNNGLMGIALEADGIMIGACLIRRSSACCYPDDGELLAIYLHPDFIGAGHGHMLYGAVEVAMREEGYTHCIVNVLTENARAVHFYEDHGFERTAHTEKAVLGGQELECVTMRKGLR